MSDDQDGCEWVSVSSGTGLSGLSTSMYQRLLNSCACVCVRVQSLQSGLQSGNYSR